MSILLPKVPTFVMKLPVTKEEITFRPFLVKEEKILIMANDAEDVDAMMRAVGDIVRECTFGKINIETAPMFDVQYAFLQIRGKSIGEIVEFVLICGECKHRTDVSLDVNAFTIHQTHGHTNRFDLGDGRTVFMKYPTFNHFARLTNDDSPEAVYEVVTDCIDSIMGEDEVLKHTPDIRKDIAEFVDNLTPVQFQQVATFIETMPVLRHELRYVCQGCENENSLVIDGINNFFE